MFDYIIILIFLVCVNELNTKQLCNILFVISAYAFFSHAYAADIILFSDQVDYPANTFGPSNVIADSMCQGIAEETIIPPYECANIFALLSYNASYAITDLPGFNSFPTSITVRSPTFTSIGTWSTILSTPSPSSGNVLVQTLVDAGVLATRAVSTDWWSGSGANGIFSASCLQWTSSSPADPVGIGWGETRGIQWVDKGSTNCNGFRVYQFICACHTGTPTPKPTRQPTADPIKSPTKNPTTNPTKNPTIRPTANPLIRVDKQQVMYRASRGTTARLYRIYGSNLTYYVMGKDINTPVNITMKETTLQPVLWTDVYWLGYNQTTNTTSTYYTGRCNPIANRIPGTTPETFNDFVLCPTIYSCIDGALHTLTNGVYTDLRACILNKTVTAREDIPSIGASEITLQAIDITATIPTPQSAADVLFGIIQCNDFIDRSINCQLAKFIPGYVAQCQGQPIQCFSYSQGRYFGGFWNANPLFRYDIPRVNWTLTHYVGIASTMNYLIYAQNGHFIDAFTSNVWNDYYWFSGLSGFEIEQVELSTTEKVTFQNDIIQGQEYNYLAGGLLPPATSGNALDPFTPSITQCIEQLIMTGDTGGICLNQDWDHLSYLQWRYPSYNYILDISAGLIVYSMTIEVHHNFTGLEVYNAVGELCGSILFPTGATVANYTISCINTPSGTSLTGANTFIQVRFFGVHAIWDVPNSTLSNSVPFPRVDDFDVQTYPYAGVINLLAATMYAFEYINTGEIGPDQFNWPGRRNDIADLVPSRFFMNFTSNTTINVNTLFGSVKNAILVNNTYPENFAIAAWSELNSYQEIPVNYSDPVHLQWLYETWANSMAPRRCTEFADCQSISHGACIYLERTDIQYTSKKNPVYWLQGEDPPDYVLPTGANEGGCYIYSDFTHGFYDIKLAGARCIEGYGPLDNENWNQIQQYSELVNDVGGEGLVGSGANCKLPASLDPISAPLVDYNLCAGHGIALYNQSVNETTFIQYSNGAQWLFPSCTGILLSEDETGEQVLYTRGILNDIYIQQFTNGNGILSIIYEQVFLNGTTCLLVEEVTGLHGILDCTVLGLQYTIQCINSFLFSHSDIQFTSNLQSIQKGLSVYSFGISVFE